MFRSFRKLCPPFTNDLKASWTLVPEDDQGPQFLRMAANWTFLIPFFESKGYYPYVWDPAKYVAVQPDRPGPSRTRDPYPYGRRFYDSEEELDFYYIEGFRVWPARDSVGRELIIRLASGPATSNELKVYQRLNSPEARRDPRNHTLPVLDYLFYDGLVFVIVPRWENIVFHCSNPFMSVSEMVNVIEVLFEGLAFLHENRISHRDILEQNFVINVLGHRLPEVPSKLLRAIEDVRYAYIDFGESLIFPMNTDINSVVTDRELRAGHGFLGMGPGLCNPFKDDIRCLARALERWTRNIEGVVPEIGPFFDTIMKNDDAHCPSAEESLKELRGIRSRLTVSQLEHPPLAFFWENGKLSN